MPVGTRARPKGRLVKGLEHVNNAVPRGYVLEPTTQQTSIDVSVGNNERAQRRARREALRDSISKTPSTSPDEEAAEAPTQRNPDGVHAENPRRDDKETNAANEDESKESNVDVSTPTADAKGINLQDDKLDTPGTTPTVIGDPVEAWVWNDIESPEIYSLDDFFDL